MDRCQSPTIAAVDRLAGSRPLENGRPGRRRDPLPHASPRKQSLTLYIMTGFPRHEALMQKLGRYTTGMSRLYIKKLDDVDMDILRELVRESFERVSKGQYGG